MVEPVQFIFEDSTFPIFPCFPWTLAITSQNCETCLKLGGRDFQRIKPRRWHFCITKNVKSQKKCCNYSSGNSQSWGNKLPINKTCICTRCFFGGISNLASTDLTPQVSPASDWTDPILRQQLPSFKLARWLQVDHGPWGEMLESCHRFTWAAFIGCLFDIGIRLPSYNKPFIRIRI